MRAIYEIKKEDFDGGRKKWKHHSAVNWVNVNDEQRYINHGKYVAGNTRCEVRWRFEGEPDERLRYVSIKEGKDYIENGD
ncbi:MAG: hypothetical protein M0T74_11480 [Desulfitobacterium hafniense]|nr:hypothetical protein [Desulfitobacterium hafniense]